MDYLCSLPSLAEAVFTATVSQDLLHLISSLWMRTKKNKPHNLLSTAAAAAPLRFSCTLPATAWTPAATHPLLSKAAQLQSISPPKLATPACEESAGVKLKLQEHWRQLQFSSATIIPVLVTIRFLEQPLIRGFKIASVRFLLSHLFFRFRRGLAGKWSASSYHVPAKYCIWISFSYFALTSFRIPEKATESWGLFLFQCIIAFVISYFCLTRRHLPSVFDEEYYCKEHNQLPLHLLVLKCSLCH